jgi:glycosyltransferase involved in cell wall biosynthesis
VIQTLTSAHDAGREARWLRPLDAVVVLSEHTRRALAAAGIAPERVHRIHPAVPEAARSVDLAAARRLLYAGDLDSQVLERLAAVARALRRPGFERWRLAIACRPKDPVHSAHAERLAGALAEDVAAGRVEILGEVADMDALLRASTLQLFAADHVRRKVDLPLVLLEGLARGIPLVALDIPPVSEIFGLGRRHGLAPGRLVDPRGGSDALAEAALAAAARPDVFLGWGADAHLLWRREFDVAGMVKQYAELYDAIGTGRGRD